MDWESEIRKKYRFVVIRSPYEVMSNQQVSEIFPDIVKFKAQGYRQAYGHNVLPFDTSDFVASHLLLCEKLPSGRLTPVLGQKSVTLKVCDDHRINFPMLGMVDSIDGNDECKTVVNQILKDYRDKNQSHLLGYNGSYTMLPQLRQDKALKEHLWDITFSLITNYYMEYNIPHVLAICSTQFHVSDRKTALGWNILKGSSGELKSFRCKALFEADFVPMEIVDVAAKSKIPSEKFKDMWNDRLTLDRDNLDILKKAS